MFHIHVCGCLGFLEGYGEGYDNPANEIMGIWFQQLKPNVRLAVIFANHPGWVLS